MFRQRSERAQGLIDSLALGVLDRRSFLTLATGLGLAGALDAGLVAAASAAGDVQSENRK